jgi:RNA polymerase sigma-70 factor (ECF subfamily)
MAKDQDEFRALMERIREGSEDAARTLIERYGRHLLYVIRRKLDERLRVKFDSVDFMQDVWASFFVKPPPSQFFATEEAFFSFLLGMARNKVNEAVRRHHGLQKQDVGREKSLDGSARLEAEGTPAPGATPSELVGAEDQWERLQQGQRDSHRFILELLRLGNTHEEIARQLGLSEKTIRRVVGQLAPRFLS